MSSWRDRFRTTAKVSVTQITKDDLPKDEDLSEDEMVFMMCSVQTVFSSEELRTKTRTKLFALSFDGGDKILVVPGNSTDDLFLYALNPRGGIVGVTAEAAADKLDLLVPNMPFSSSQRCSTCDKRFRGGDAVYSIMSREKPRRDFCRLHVRRAMKYNNGGALAYSFQAADDLDRADPVVLWNLMMQIPQTMATMDYVLRDVVEHAKKTARRGRLSKEWKKTFEAVDGTQRSTIVILKFTARRVLAVQQRSLEEMIGND